MKYILKQKSKSDENLAREAFKPGMILYGYCGGIFGRDSHGNKTIVEVDVTHNSIMVLESNGAYNTAFVESWVGLLESSNSSLATQEDDVNGQEDW
jgi:hypothetical protein